MWYRHLRVFFFTAGMLLAAGYTAPADDEWRVYDNCHLEESDSNDGDSFWMKYSRPGYGRRYFIRLYFVDCPESDSSVPDRVREQAEYWGISEDQVILLGKQATKFTRRFLKDGFVVKSKLQDALGRSNKKRNYANVYVGDLSLAEALVANGLARIHGFQVMHPDGPKPSTMNMRLKAAEKDAQKAGNGVWAFANSASPSMGPRETPTLPTHNPLSGRKTLSSISSGLEHLNSGSSATVQGRPSVEPHDRTLGRAITVYSLKDGSRKGVLRAGHRIKVLGEEPDNMVRIRFRWGEKIIEAQCLRAELGI